MKTEQNNQIPFLDVLLLRNVETISTTVYRNVINTDLSLLITRMEGL